MTVEKFFETLKLVLDLDRDFKLGEVLAEVSETLQSLVDSPAQPTYQSSLAAAMDDLDLASGQLQKRLSPSQTASIVEIGGKAFFDSNIGNLVRASVEKNAMTPSVAADFAEELFSSFTAFVATVKQTLEGLGKLNVTDNPLTPGTADMAFVIPRDLFANHLGPFAKELVFINRLIQHYGEAVAAKVEPVELEQLSSSVPTIALLADPRIIEAIANAVNKFLGAWEKIEKIRRIRSELKEMRMNVGALDELTEQITTTVDEVVEESTQLTLKGYKGEATRRNELENAIKQDTHRLFGQIERGLTIQFRAAPAEEPEPDQQSALEAIDKTSRILQFPAMKAEPMLLSSGQVLEGDLVVTHTSTKKTSTTTVKKTASKNATK